MLVYLVLLFVLLLFDTSRWKLGFVFGCLLIFIISAFRSPNVGTDTINYVIGFVSDEFRAHMSEVGFLTFSGLIRAFTKNEFWFLFFTSFIALFPVFFVVKKLSHRPTYSLLIFVCFDLVFWLSGMRQAIALSFYTLFLYYAIQKSYIKAIVFYLVSLSFHFSVLITLPIIIFSYFVSYYSHRKKLIFLIVVTALLGVSKMVKINDLIPWIASMMGLEKYAYYAVYNFGESIPVTRLFVQIVPFSFFSLLHLKYSGKNEVNILTSLFIYGTIINNLILIHPIGFRMAKYFSLLLILLVPTLLIYINDKYRMFFRFGFLFFIVTYFVYGLYSRLATAIELRNDVVPYEFIKLLF